MTLLNEYIIMLLIYINMQDFNVNMRPISDYMIHGV